MEVRVLTGVESVGDTVDNLLSDAASGTDNRHTCITPLVMTCLCLPIFETSDIWSMRSGLEDARCCM